MKSLQETLLDKDYEVGYFDLAFHNLFSDSQWRKTTNGLGNPTLTVGIAHRGRVVFQKFLDLIKQLIDQSKDESGKKVSVIQIIGNSRKDESDRIYICDLGRDVSGFEVNCLRKQYHDNAMAFPFDHVDTDWLKSRYGRDFKIIGEVPETTIEQLIQCAGLK